MRIFDPFLKIDTQEKMGGIFVHKQPLNSIILIRTRNSEYVMEVLEDRQVSLVGGKRINRPIVLHFNGSTWGGSMLKMDWIGYEMHMEFVTNEGIFTTSPVRDARVFTEDLNYELGWSEW